MQALREKFAAAANEECSPAQELEVRWVRAQPGLPPKAPDTFMAEATLTLPGIQPELGAVKRGSRGSKFHWAATRAEGMSAQLNRQLKEQEISRLCLRSMTLPYTLGKFLHAPHLPCHRFTHAKEVYYALDDNPQHALYEVY